MTQHSWVMVTRCHICTSSPPTGLVFPSTNFDSVPCNMCRDNSGLNIICCCLRSRRTQDQLTEPAPSSAFIPTNALLGSSSCQNGLANWVKKHLGSPGQVVLASYNTFNSYFSNLMQENVEDYVRSQPFKIFTAPFRYLVLSDPTTEENFCPKSRRTLRTLHMYNTTAEENGPPESG